MSYFLVGYNILEQDLERVLKLKSSVDKSEYFKFNSIKVLDTTDFSVLDLSLDIIRYNSYIIIGTTIPVYGDLSVNLFGEIKDDKNIVKSNVWSCEENINSPLYYSDKLVFPASSSINNFIRYKGSSFTLKISLITFNFYLEIYGFPVLGNNIEEFNGAGLEGNVSFLARLDIIFNSIFETFNSINYFGDTFAILRLNNKHKDYIIKNGVKYIALNKGYINCRFNSYNIVIPPTVEGIRFYGTNDSDIGLNIMAPKGKEATIVDGLCTEFSYLSYEEKVEMLLKDKVKIVVY